MSKWYEVVVKASKVIVVEMEDDANEDDAAHYAMLEADLDYSNVYESEASLLTEANVETAKRHADDVYSL